MFIPYEIIIKIFSYLPTEKCYRCNKTIEPLKKITKLKHNNKILKLCSMNCCEYQHY